MGAEATHEDAEVQFQELLEDVQEYEDERKDEIPGIGLDWEAEKVEQRREFADRLEDIDRDELGSEGTVDYDIMERELDKRITRFDHDIHLMPVNHEGGPHSSFIRHPSRRSFEDKEDYEEYLERLQQAPAYFEEAIGLLQTGLEKGMTPTCAVLDGHDEMIDSYLVDPTESDLYEPFESIPESIPEEDRERYREGAKKAIVEDVYPALELFRDFLIEEYIPETRESFGYLELPDGKTYYEFLVEYYTSLDVTPDDVHQIGLEEVDRIREEMLEVINDADFDGDFDEFVEFLRTDSQFYPDSAEELLKEASYIAKDIDGKLPQLFSLEGMPTRPYGVEPVPDDLAPSYTSGRYSLASTDTDSGAFWVNTYNLSSRPLYALPSLFLHEAVPGHHLQIAHTKELEDISEFRRDHGVTAFSEGWALYSEHLGNELDAFDTPYEHFGRLSMEMWRACRLVIDTGIHAKGWSREKAREFMANNTALSMHNVRTEVDRYIATPGQAVAYKMGEITIRDLREEAEDELGAEFDVRKFHEVLLENGPVPLPTLEDNVRDWIDEVKAQDEDDGSGDE